MQAAVGLAEDSSVEVRPLDPDSFGKINQVVQTGFDGFGVGEKDSHARPNDGFVEPILASRGLDLLDVEKNRSLPKVLKKQP